MTARDDALRDVSGWLRGWGPPKIDNAEVLAGKILDSLVRHGSVTFEVPESGTIPLLVSGPERVDHPPHYNAHPSGVECIDVVEHMTFNVGNAIKYLWRADHKGDRVEDLKKARWYIDREIERLERTT